MPTEKRSQINNVGFHLQKLKKKSKLNLKQAEEENNTDQSRINEIETIKKVKSWLFEIKVRKLYKSLASLTQKKKDTNEQDQKLKQPSLVWLSGLSACLQTKGSLVQLPIRAYAWVAGQVPSGGPMRGNRTLVFLSLSFSLPSLLSKNK